MSTESSRAQFDEVEAEFETSSSWTIIVAVFETILHLTMSFLVLAGFRMPTLSLEDRKRADVVAQLQRTVERFHETEGELAALKTGLEIPHLSNTDAREWARGITDRATKSERNAVDQIQLADLTQLPAINLAELVPLDHAGNVVSFGKGPELNLAQNHTVPAAVEMWRKKHEDALVQAVTDAVVQKVSVKKHFLFPSTREAIRAKVQTLLASRLQESYAKYVEQEANGQALDWSAFAADSGGQPASSNKYPATFVTYAKAVCALVPNPKAMPNAEAAEKSLNGTLHEQFAAKCKSLNDDDQEMEKRIRATASSKPLMAINLCDDDKGLETVKVAVCTKANCNKDATHGPLTKSALKQVTEELFANETKRIQGKAIADLQTVTWATLEQGKDGCKVGYNDHDKQDSKTTEIAGRLLVCIGLPKDKEPTDKKFASRLNSDARTRADTLFREQISKGQTETQRQVLDLIKQYEPVIKAGTTELAKKAVSYPDGARGDVLEEISRKLGIKNPKPEHETAWKEQARKMIARAVQARRNKEGERLAQSTHEILDNKFLNKLTPLDWDKREKRVAEIQAELIRNAPEEFHKDGEFKKAQQSKAEGLFDERMKVVEQDFQHRAEDRIRQLVASQPPDIWRTYTEEEIADKVYESLLQELVKELSKPSAK